MARAMFRRCFWPPDTVMPRSPISVRSPSGNISRSDRKAQASMTLLYHSSSYSLPNRMLFLTDVFWIQADCGQKARVAPILAVPSVILISPARAESREVFPHPTVPITARSSFRPTVKVRLVSLKGSTAVRPPEPSSASFCAASVRPWFFSAAPFSGCLDSVLPLPSFSLVGTRSQVKDAFSTSIALSIVLSHSISSFCSSARMNSWIRPRAVQASVT